MSTPPGLLDLTPLFAPNAELEDSTLMPPDTVAPSTHEGQQEPSKQVAMGQSNIMGPEKMTQDKDASKEFEQPETQTQLISLQEIEASSQEEWLTLAQRLKTEERWGEAIAAYKQALSQEASPDHQNHSGQESSNKEQQTGSSSQSFEQLQAQALTYGQQRQWQACIETCEQALALQPTASLNKLLGDVLQLTGRLSEAQRSYREALRLRPDFAEVYGNLGNLYAQERQWPRAIECFRRALRYQPQRVALHRALARVWEQVGNEIEAVRCWHRVLGLDPASGQAQDYFSLGNRWVRLGDWSMAERYYREAIARDEQLTDAWHNLAEVLAHHQNWPAAREMYEQILQREPQRVISRLGYTRVLTKLEDWQGAMAEYHRLAESAPEQVLAQQRFAQTLEDQGLLEEAIAVYRRALTFAPNGFELRLGFAELLCEQEQWEDALPQAEAAIALNSQVAQAHYYAGRAQVARANWQAAIPYLEQAVTLDSQFFWSRYFWGEALLGLEDWQGAAAVLDAAMPLNPEYPGGYCHLGLAFLELEQYSEAVQAYRQAIAFGSNDVSYSHLGLALLKLEDWDGAIDVLNRGLELKPDDEEFHWLLSQVFVEKQDWQAAIEAVGRAVALKPEGLEFNPQFKQLLCRQGPLHEAVDDWQQAVDLNRDDPQLQLGLGVALLEGEIDLERAEACLRRNLELQPNQPQGYFYLGKCSAGQGRLDEALGFYRRSWELSQSVDCGLALAEVLQQLGRWSEAVQQYRQVLLECGESGEALFGLGQALAASERPMEAVMEWRRAIGLGWNSPELYRCLAEALVSLERWDEAVLEWGRLLELQPGNALVRRQRALALIGLGRWPESAQEWQQYWQVAPGSGQGTLLDFRSELGMYGEIPHRQELSLTGDLTVEFWLRLREWPQGWTNLVGKFVSDEENEFCLRLKNGERGQWYYGGGEGCTKPLTWVPQETIRLHQWVHIACVRKLGQSGQLYVDGVLQGEQDWGQESGATPTEAPVRLMLSSRLDEFLDGQLSEIRVWNVARTSDEIRRGMSEKLETELGLVAVWSGSEDGIVVDRVADHPGEMKQASANGKPRPQVGVCSGEWSQKAVDRADTLAQLYAGFAQVELISSQFPQSEGQVSQPIRETEIPCHRIQAEHEEQFLEQALALVLAHPYEVVHLSQPRMPNMILGLLYKLLWNARVLVDIDDEELSLVGASETLDLGMLLSSEEPLPPLLDLLGQDWTRIAVGLANCDGFRALDSTSVGEAEESLARLVAEVLAVPGCGLSDEWVGLLQRLPAIESVQSKLGNSGILRVTNDPPQVTTYLDIKFSPIVLFTPYYRDKHPARQDELIYCLQKNIDCPKINKIILLIDDDHEPELTSPKIEIIRISSRATYLDWITLTQERFNNCISVLANTDIYFDASISKTKYIFEANANAFVALSRHDKEGHQEILHSNPHWSQDAWVVYGQIQLSESFKKSLNISLGVPRCDNKIAYVFAIQGNQVYNPCHDVKAIHVQETQLRSYSKYTDTRILGGTAWVYPSDNIDTPSHLKLDIWTLSPIPKTDLQINHSLIKWLKKEAGDTSFENEGNQDNDQDKSKAIADHIVAWDSDWQYPVITEKHAYESIKTKVDQHDFNKNLVYFGFPWATLIDYSLHNNDKCHADQLTKKLKSFKDELGKYKKVITVCQHIHLLRFQDIFAEVGITDVFWSHTTQFQNSLPSYPEIALHPFPLYPVQAVNIDTTKPESEKKYLYSFVGSRSQKNYLTNTRDMMLDLLADDDRGLIIPKDQWHYQKIVYDHQILKRDPDIDTNHFVDKSSSDNFKEVVQDSIFSLCPSGSGCNSIRLWESVGLGAIPVILSDTYLPPGDQDLWDEATVSCPERADEIKELPKRLANIAADSSLLHKKRQALKKIWEKYGPENFVADIIDVMSKKQSVKNTKIEKQNFKPSYTWPNPCFPFRVYYQSLKCRIFIIENIQHNWNWMSKWHENFRKTDFFFVYCGWYHSPGFADESDRIFSILNLDKSRFFFLYNSPLEMQDFSKKGFQGDVINHNAWLDENKVMKPIKLPKIYDAIYVARRSAMKRHMLASKVSHLALVAGNNHGNNISDVPTHKYLNETPLSSEEVCYKINQSFCGLSLSEVEGACFSSSEYLLCGIPVVSTVSKGGRDVWYNDYNSIVCDPDPDAIASAVDEFVKNPRDPQRIRQMHIEQAEIYRKKFIEVLSEIFNRFGVLDVDPEKHFQEQFLHKLRKSYQPNFQEIFASNNHDQS